MEHTVEKNHVRAVARAGPVFRTVAGVAFALLGCAVLGGCDKAIKPKEVKYNIYIGGTNTFVDPAYSKIYVYDADSLALIDSFPQAHFIDELVVSPNGQWLYIRDRPMEDSLLPTLRKVDAKTKQVVWSRTDEVGRPGKGYIGILRNGELLLSRNDVLRSEDGSLVRHLDDSLFTRFGPVSGTKVAAIVRGSPLRPNWPTGYDSIVTIVDVTTGETSGRYVAHLSSGVTLQQIITARLHPDGRRVLVTGLYGNADYTWFVVGDIETGQTLFEYHIYRLLGEIAISNDGNLAAVTDPGIPVLIEGGILHIVDLQTMLSVPSRHPIRAGQVRFLPGDRQIITAPSSGWGTHGPMQVIDLATLTVERTIYQPIQSDIGGLGVGPRP